MKSKEFKAKIEKLLDKNHGQEHWSDSYIERHFYSETNELFELFEKALKQREDEVKEEIKNKVKERRRTPDLAWTSQGITKGHEHRDIYNQAIEDIVESLKQNTK